MDIKELRAELSVKMLDLDRAIDLGMPYAEIKKVYSEIKHLQYDLLLACCKDEVKSESDLIID